MGTLLSSQEETPNQFRPARSKHGQHQNGAGNIQTRHRNGLSATNFFHYKKSEKITNPPTHQNQPSKDHAPQVNNVFFKIIKINI
ncbi:MAG: hypothetical protein UR98_C0004G0026 [Parcubacteria group bacterium GW2011_GWA1_36_12]|nr:MAG: hypothetical protein UR98_C0004G0026 [Parcubacteria group bacterium GW2011_GWA1_36_12]